MTTDGEPKVDTEVIKIGEGARNESLGIGGRKQGLRNGELEDAKRKAKENKNAWNFGRNKRYG